MRITLLQLFLLLCDVVGQSRVCACVCVFRIACIQAKRIKKEGKKKEGASSSLRAKRNAKQRDLTKREKGYTEHPAEAEKKKSRYRSSKKNNNSITEHNLNYGFALLRFFSLVRTAIF